MRRSLNRVWGVPLAALLLVPMAWSLWGALAAARDPQAWSTLWADPQTLPALGMSLWTGVASTLLATALSAWLVSVAFFGRRGANWTRLQRWLAPMLAVPHATFAIGLVALLAPSGWLLRAVSPWATGFETPPPWPTTQDPWGLGLIATLALKEIPFLLWAAAALLNRPDVSQRLQRELQLAATLGYTPRTAWWRVAMPQLAPRLAAPALAVWAYSLTVVDVALVIGPTGPPTLAVLAWQWLQDAETARNAQGAAAAWVLAGTAAAAAAGSLWLARSPVLRRRWSEGATGAEGINSGVDTGTRAAGVLLVVYIAVLLALLLGSVVGSWPFPALWPETFTLEAWHSVAGSAVTVGTTLWLALASGAAALVWVVVWLEWSGTSMRLPDGYSKKRSMESLLPWVLYLPLVLPAVLWVVGLHRMALAWDIGTSVIGVWLAHTLMCLPYVYLALVGPYRDFPDRAWQVAASLGHGHWVFLWRIKWPLLRAALWSAFAVGFAVSVAQYLPTLYVGAGRFATVSTEAVTLSAGGQRSLTAAFAWLQWLLPVLVFALASRFGRARRFATLGTRP